MGQKVNPHGLRVGVIKGWDSRWYAKDDAFGDLLVEDYNIRKFLKKKLYAAGVPQIEIERNSKQVKIIIHCARPGIIVGKGGSEIEKLRVELEKMIKKNVNISIVEVRSPDLNAQLVAENIAAQLEKRVSFRRAMKQAIGRAMKLGAKGIKVSVSGRLGGAEIARTEHYHDGTIPLQTLRADIDYGFAEANTTYGRIGVKVWLYKGEILTGGPRTTEVEAPRRDRRDRRDGDRRNNRNGRGGNRQGGYQNRNGQGNRQGGYQNRGNGGYRNQNNGQGAPAARPPKTEGGAQ
ncbi:MAG TPA: 30S ribosomal protein S3 [Firmicutes bacterium]|nr:30S ribosomal protein S3 [Bacillota bacterium]